MYHEYRRSENDENENEYIPVLVRRIVMVNLVMMMMMMMMMTVVCCDIDRENEETVHTLDQKRISS